MRPIHWLLPVLIPIGSAFSVGAEIDFNRDIRPILSNKCFACHGPDEEKLEAGLRLDLRDVAIRQLDSGKTAIVPGQPDSSELLSRITSPDDDLRMPPAGFGKPLTEDEIALIRQWIEQGAGYAVHWSYVRPERPELPAPVEPYAHWPQNPIDHFVLSRMLLNGLTPSAEADVRTLCRRIFLDLTGLPPSPDEVESFVAAADKDPLAWERLVDDLLKRPTFGEHWARQWLDLARYADSAGYADDPSRTIWAYRDWVIRAINSNLPFDQFTLYQMAGDLLPDASDEQLIATAFHRNTLTNNEGGTQDEEFRNVAVVDRVNTTMAVWMGTTIACAQCHSHKYDPISQEDYFRFFAILNNTQDADRRDESPVLELFTDVQRERQRQLSAQITELEHFISAPNAEVEISQQTWEAALRRQPLWSNQKPVLVTRSSELSATISADAEIIISEAAETDVFVVDLPLNVSDSTKQLGGVAAIRLQTVPDNSLPGGGSGHGGGNFVITEFRAQLVPADESLPSARFVRIEIPGKQRILSLAEVQVFRSGDNVALAGTASQSSTDFGGPAALAIDNRTDGEFQKKSVTHTAVSDDPWWELDLKSELPVELLKIWNRTDNGVQSRLVNFRLTLLDSERRIIWQTEVEKAPDPSVELTPTGVREVPLRSAFADYHQPNFEPQEILDGRTEANNGWAIGGSTTELHELIVVPEQVIRSETPAVLRLIIEQKSPYKQHLLGKFQLSVTEDEVAIARAGLPSLLQTILDLPVSARDEQQHQNLNAYYREQVAPEFAVQRQQLAEAKRELDSMKPATSVPVLRELVDNRRITRLQYRGSYLDLGPEVDSGVPGVFHPLPPGSDADRLSLARWLVDPENPLTARVLANRYWESLFGRGIVVTSEEFGSQGELPTHPELLDWLAVELVQNGWDTRALLRLIVTSSTYRQSSLVTPETIALDRDNRWLARGPRVRLSAEMIRDQALFVSGLLSQRMFGEPVNPPQPNLGLTAAFGSSTDWKTSEGSDRYRRGIYTTWRRSNPYPSMATFDAPNREVCTVRRNQTNTPLQSLVTLNDPVYVEAAQALARLALGQYEASQDQLKFVFHRCLLRPPEAAELEALESLYGEVRKTMQEQPDDAARLASEPLGTLPQGIDAVSAAALTVVCNVLLNLDEMLSKP